MSKLKIIWSDFAESELDKIYAYYIDAVNVKIARSIINGIITASSELS